MATKKQDNKTTVVPTEAPATNTTPAKKSTAKSAGKEKADAASKPARAEQAEKVRVVAKTKVTFELPKEAVENAETVAVLGDFNQWDIQKGIELKKQKDGSFKTSVELEAGRNYQYRFLIDGTRWENAWNAAAYEPTPFGTYNSVVKA
jgi:pyruvate/2-oxoglutarate dehydrogenase complex dihydrolipoamide acyltransferase (E2) component